MTPRRSPAARSASSAMTSCARSSRSAIRPLIRLEALDLPDMALMLSDALVIFDHLKHTVTILANADLDAEPDIERAYAEAARTIAEVRSVLAGPVPRGEPVDATTRQVPEFKSNMSREHFEGMVSRIVEYIYAGDAFQVVPSQRWSAPCPSRPSRSTAACARSTRAPTCTSSTSATSRSPARAPSRC